MASNFGELVLILGDLHIPGRASKIPAPFKRMLVPNKMNHVICTGNLSSADFDELRSLAPNVHIVSGNYDDAQTSSALFPETRVVQVGSFRIGVIHGHQMLPWGSQGAIETMRRKLGADILVSGHTHQNVISVEDDFMHINPVSPRASALFSC
jgi:vacuolar protein sorting-associated protein 29